MKNEPKPIEINNKNVVHLSDEANELLTKMLLFIQNTSAESNAFAQKSELASKIIISYIKEVKIIINKA